MRGGAMNVFNQLYRLGKLHTLILQRKTGTPTELGRSLGISVSRLSRIIAFLRDSGAPIRYDRSSCTYYYTEPFTIDIKLKIGSYTYRLG